MNPLLVAAMLATLIPTNITWTASPSDDVAYYNVYYTPPGGTSWIWKKSAVDTRARAKIPAHYYYNGGKIGVSAVDTSENESTITALVLEGSMLQDEKADDHDGDTSPRISVGTVGKIRNP